MQKLGRKMFSIYLSANIGFVQQDCGSSRNDGLQVGCSKVFFVSVKYISGDYLGNAAALQDWVECDKNLAFALQCWVCAHSCTLVQPR